MKKLLIIIATALCLASCSKDFPVMDNSVEGTKWVHYNEDSTEGVRLTFAYNSVSLSYGNLRRGEGTYVQDGNKVTFFGLSERLFTTSRYTYAIVDGDEMTVHYIYGEGDVLLPKEYTKIFERVK